MLIAYIAYIAHIDHIDYIDYIDYVELCHGFLAIPMCLSWLSYRGLQSYRVVYWRANTGLLLSYFTIPLA